MYFFLAFEYLVPTVYMCAVKHVTAWACDYVYHHNIYGKQFSNVAVVSWRRGGPLETACFSGDVYFIWLSYISIWFSVSGTCFKSRERGFTVVGVDLIVWISSRVVGSNSAAVSSGESLQAATSAQYFSQIPGKVTLVTLGNTRAVTTRTLEDQKNTLIT